MNYTNKIEDLHLQGLITDTYRANLNFEIFKKIQFVWSKIRDLEKNDATLINYLKNSSKELTIIYLARLFEKKSNKFPTRCLDELITQLLNANIHFSENELTRNKWQNFARTNELLIEQLNKYSECNKENFLINVQRLIDEEKGVKNSALYKLKTWRDKSLAHNEHFEEIIKLDLEEVEFLLSIPNSVIQYINEFVPSGSIIYIPTGSTNFVTHLLKRLQLLV